MTLIVPEDPERNDHVREGDRVVAVMLRSATGSR